VAHEAYTGAKDVDRDYGDYTDDRATNSVEERRKELFLKTGQQERQKSVQAKVKGKRIRHLVANQTLEG
jgi:hypothetical protein